MHTTKRIVAVTSACMTLALLMPAIAEAGIIFQDDFNDGNANGWTFKGTDSGEWGVFNGSLNSSIGDGDEHDAVLGVAYITGITTPNHFIFEADVSVQRYKRPDGTVDPDRGHVGFVWGFDGATYNYTTSDWVTSYLRTHEDRITTWSRENGAGQGETFLNVGTVTNGPAYHMKIKVDYASKFMQITFDAASTTITGAAFDTYVRHAGGNIGLVNWGEEVTYDNVTLTDLSVSAVVPEPSSLAVAGIGGFGALIYGRRRGRARLSQSAPPMASIASWRVS